MTPHMPKSLLEQLPEIVKEGRRQAERILESLEGRHRVRLQTREWVLPSRDTSAADWIGQAQRRAHLDADGSTGWTNRLIYGDNLHAMAALLAGDDDTPSLRGQVDLIYIDPPFDSKADYRTKVVLPGVELEQKPTVIEQFAYSDTWSNGTTSYLATLVPRLTLMRELLAETGSLLIHLDWHIGHYAKIVLDEIFGKNNFRNELIWYYYNKMPDTRNKAFPRSHDVIFWYTKNARSDYYFKHQEEKRGKPVKQLVRKKVDGRMVNARDEQGNVLYNERDARTVDSVWRLPMLQPADRKENSGYVTQKPESIAERIMLALSESGDLVADFNGGSGTTAAVAEKLGRRWITTDLGKPACMIMRKRLIDQGAKPFLYQAIGDYHVESAKTHFGRNFRMGDLSEIVLSLYGALPLPVEDNPLRNLGQVSFQNRKTLVVVDSPNKLTGEATLRKAIGLRENLLGGWDRVVILGWNFEPSIGQAVTALADDRLDVLVIPPDLLDRLRKKGGIEKLRGQIRFSSLQYLKVKPARRVPFTAAQGEPREEILVELDNYTLLNPEAINLDEDNRRKLLRVMNADPLALIEYWAVDPDYDGQVFRSVWQDYRGNTDNDGDPLRVIRQARLDVPHRTGERRVCVRAVDVFGFEAEVVQVVGEPQR